MPRAGGDVADARARGPRGPRRALVRLRWALWALVILAFLAGTRGRAQLDAYAGTSLGGSPAPSFRLTDQHGRSVSLADYRGRVVLLTFLDGHCKDVCPTTLRVMGDIQRRLGADAARLALVAISVDPWLDRVGEPAAIAQEDPAHAPRQWDFLTGTLEQLRPVWSAYHVTVVEQLVGTYGANGEHDTGFFLIDAQGRQRLYIQSDADEGVIVRQVRRLIEESGR
ncbi:MAG: SCO family protein [Clostridia bacterium]|nr:SCO family protein [Clostridia bacterium]